jgi:hypothetical protein
MREGADEFTVSSSGLDNVVVAEAMIGWDSNANFRYNYG